MSDLAVQKIMVRRGAPEPVHENILDVYRWLGGRLAQEPVRLISPKHTIYVTSEEFHSRNFEIHRHLTGELPVGRGTRYLILDLTGNPYNLLGESLLYHIAVIAQEWIASASRRVLAILVPKRPPETSAFWIPLRSSGKASTVRGRSSSSRTTDRASGRTVARRASAAVSRKNTPRIGHRRTSL